MLDIILLQHPASGIKLLEYRQDHTKISSKHADIFSGFMSAIQNISTELDIGTLILISTEGSEGHNCIIIPKIYVNVIILVDQEDPIDLWREQGHLIAEKFLEEFGNDYQPNIVSKFESFTSTIKALCSTHEFCE
ncbi:MAG: hypothetical protein KGD66_07365 [Candidatus Lokiarchaeota archaeon]|nr:hypothetical protein [Candidatus Lokiarchaeota archaeon]